MIYDITADDLLRYIGELYVEKCEAEKKLTQLTLHTNNLLEASSEDKEKS